MKNIFLMGLAVAILGLTACHNTEDPSPADPFEGMTAIYAGSTGVEAVRLTVYMEEDPFVGFNRVYVRLYDTLANTPVDNWELQLAPMMTMMMEGGMMQHSCPFEQPVYDTETGAYSGAVVFIMPTTDMGYWTFHIIYTHENGQGEVVFRPVVKEKAHPAMVSFVSEADNATKYFVALIEPQKPGVGINDFEIGIYTKESMMSFPPAGRHTVAIDPEMPSMGHGSPDNVNPQDAGNGRYRGKVNFTMTGLWRVHMKIANASGQVVKTDAWFDIEF